MKPIQMPIFSIKTARFWQNLALFFLLAGAVLRVLVWWQNRTLFIDEANLFRNFIEKPWAAFFSQLDYGQYSPPLFSLLEKATIQLFGISERVARFWPLVAGLLSLPLAWRVGQRFLSPVGRTIFSLFMAFEGTFISYSSQVKQYSFDGLAILALLECSQRVDFQRNKWAWGLLGAAVVWLSMPSIFMLAAIGCWLGWRFFREKNGRAIVDLALVGGAWLASFAAYYFLILNENVQNDALRVSHIFLPFPPKTGADFAAWWNAISGLSNWTVGFTVVAYFVFFSGLAAGAWSFFQKKSADWMPVVLPIVFGLAAVAAGFYSMMERLWLFALPLILLWLAVGWDVFLKGKSEKSKVKNEPAKSKNGRSKIEFNSLIFKQLPRFFAAALLLLCASVQLKYDWFWRPFQIEEFREALEFMEPRHRPGDSFFVHHDAAPVVHYYLKLADRRFPFSENSVLENWRAEPNFWQKDLLRLLENAAPGSRCRLLWDGKMAGNDLDFLKKTGGWRLEFSFRGGELWVLE